jgi:hypothetical protein
MDSPTASAIVFGFFCSWSDVDCEDDDGLGIDVSEGDDFVVGIAAGDTPVVRRVEVVPVAKVGRAVPMFK